MLTLLISDFGEEQTEQRGGLTVAAGELAQALDRQLLAEQRQGSNTRILMSFIDANGTLCRGFVRADLSGIACRRDDDWHLRVQREGVNVEANDYRQASSVDAAVLAAARDLAVGPALDPGGESAARARGWRAQ